MASVTACLSSAHSEFFRAYDEVVNQRSAAIADLEITEVKDGFVMDGYAAVFDETTDLGEFTEEIRHGAFRKVLASGANVPLLVEHKPEYLLASTKSGRLRLFEEPRGLRVSANVPDTDLSRRVKTLADSGDLTGMSFGFVVGRERANSEHVMRNGRPHRIIKNFKRLIDVTTTWDPAYASAEAQFRTQTLANAELAAPLQQILLGIYPQLEDGATVPDGDDEETRTDGDLSSGVSHPRLAARKRQLHLLSLTLEGGDFE